eukprot:519201-Rhodomonas_salina.1
MPAAGAVAWINWAGSSMLASFVERRSMKVRWGGRGEEREAMGQKRASERRGGGEVGAVHRLCAA